MSASGFGLSLIWGFLSRWNGAHLRKAIKPAQKQNGRPFRVALTRFGAALHRPQINSLKAIRRNDRHTFVTRITLSAYKNHSACATKFEKKVFALIHFMDFSILKPSITALRYFTRQ
jgi:hypothetical protein